ncbi:putative hydrolase of the HAD superfamily [Novosphingobium sp. PhB165]|uniref:HAD family hydrolase n=1 Tax=Novosphingobium sp. PhB165 TaxID=2485105 RepID=UPI00104D826D|nr:HAD hydrolase-like protein [Novosphingobium sp. PhB165]TCM21362.1 putative hydrolase of the HAD superfamily [Novosphingobium sp. PhB165]
MAEVVLRGGWVVVLDLDDTLYLERDFALSGFGVVGRRLEAMHGITGFAEECARLLEAGVRGSIFDRALAALGAADAGIAVAGLVEVYRGHRPRITLAPDAARLLDRIDGPASALITDGPARMQAAKVGALGLGGRLGRLVLTGMLPPGCSKPHAMPYQLVERWSGQSPSEHVYIADNSAKDFIAPRARGWQTVQILREGRIHHGEPPTSAHAADVVIDTLDALIFERSGVRSVRA